MVPLHSTHSTQSAISVSHQSAHEFRDGHGMMHAIRHVLAFFSLDITTTIQPGWLHEQKSC